MTDPSNGYEAIAAEFVAGRVRSPIIGVATVREWARALPQGGTVLDVGCGTGVPISQTLIDLGFSPAAPLTRWAGTRTSASCAKPG